MSQKELLKTFYWSRWSKKLERLIDHPRFFGRYSTAEAEEKDCILLTRSYGSRQEGMGVAFYWLVDKKEKRIRDACFQVFGSPLLIGAADAVCELVMDKRYSEVAHLGPGLIDRHLRDQRGAPAFPEEGQFPLNLAFFALSEVLADFRQLSTKEPLSLSKTSMENWPTFSRERKIQLIEEVLDREIRPFLLKDGGDVLVIDFKEDKEIVLMYQGACATCQGALGGTLSFIQRTLQENLSPDLFVTPQFLEDAW